MGLLTEQDFSLDVIFYKYVSWYYVIFSRVTYFVILCRNVIFFTLSVLSNDRYWMACVCAPQGTVHRSFYHIATLTLKYGSFA